MTTEVKKTRKPRAKKATKKAAENKDVSLNIYDILSWDDAKCNEMNNEVRIPLIQIRDILAMSTDAQNKYNVIRTVLRTGAMTGYSVECPQCHKVLEVNPRDLVREGEAVCSGCGCSYNQVEAIRGITTYEKDNK